MITPTTRLFGLIMSDPRIEGHVTRLYNYLMGFNGLDGAYLSFVVKPEHLSTALEGFVQTAKCEVLHVAPVHQATVTRLLHEARAIDMVTLGEGRAMGTPLRAGADWLAADEVVERARRDLAHWFDCEPQAPPDWREVLTEKTFRPCKLTHDDFKEHHAARRSA